MKRSDSKPTSIDAMADLPMRWPGLSYGVLPLTIMIIVVIACLIGYSLATASLEATRSSTIDRRLVENKLRISSVFDTYAQISWGSTGRLQSGEADSAAWRRFMSVYNIPKNFTGMEAIGVSYGDSPEKNVIRYVTPHTPETIDVRGFDLGTAPQLMDAMKRAARDGQTTASSALPDFFSTKDDVRDKKNGFLMFTPFYDSTLPQSTPEERERALRGYTVAMFRGDLFFGLAFKNTNLSHTKIKVYLGEPSPKNKLYEGGTVTDKDVRTVKQHINQYGQSFTLIYDVDTAHILAWPTTYFPQFLMFGGLLMGLLFAAISGYMLRNRFYRLTYEKERDVEFAKDELLSLASHQLRTPATGVKQYLGMVLQGFAGDITPKQREYLQRAYASNNRQLGVINDILHLAKLETGRIVLAERKFDITKMVRDVVEEQTETAEKGEIRMLLQAPTQGLIMGDSHMLRMVIENLVSNAIKYTPAGGVVTIRLTRRTTRWVLMVKDTGVGIAKSDFPKLFKQFSRINNPRTEIVTGTGVGLYLAYHLTVLHGGTISVASKKGKGSTFTVRLPRKL